MMLISPCPFVTRCADYIFYKIIVGVERITESMDRFMKYILEDLLAGFYFPLKLVM